MSAFYFRFIYRLYDKSAVISLQQVCNCKSTKYNKSYMLAINPQVIQAVKFDLDSIITTLNMQLR